MHHSGGACSTRSRWCRRPAYRVVPSIVELCSVRMSLMATASQLNRSFGSASHSGDVLEYMSSVLVSCLEECETCHQSILDVLCTALLPAHKASVRYSNTYTILMNSISGGKPRCIQARTNNTEQNGRTSSTIDLAGTKNMLTSTKHVLSGCIQVCESSSCW